LFYIRIGTEQTITEKMKKIALVVFWLMMAGFSAFAQKQELSVITNGLSAGQSNELSVEFQNPAVLHRINVTLSSGQITLTNIYREQSGAWIPFWFTVDSSKFRSVTEPNLVLLRSEFGKRLVYFQTVIPPNTRLKIEGIVSMPISETARERFSDYTELSLALYSGSGLVRNLQTRIAVKNN
jgi:hypothetical protein